MAFGHHDYSNYLLLGTEAERDRGVVTLYDVTTTKELFHSSHHRGNICCCDLSQHDSSFLTG